MESSVPDVDCPPVVMDALLSILAESILMIRLARIMHERSCLLALSP